MNQRSHPLRVGDGSWYNPVRSRGTGTGRPEGSPGCLVLLDSAMTPVLRILWQPWWAAGREGLAAMESLLPPSRGGLLSLALIAASTMASWFMYVPVHELLHAFACMATGGTVGELRIQALYGGAILERIFPFVRADGEHAGRLTGFDTGGSDLVYLATDAAPYLLTLLGGFWLLRLARARGSALLFGPAVVLLAAPLLSLSGDYYEMGSILVSDALRLLGASRERVEALRHDDLWALLGEFGRRFPERRGGWAAAVAASGVAGYLLASATLAGSRAWNRWISVAGASPRDGASVEEHRK